MPSAFQDLPATAFPFLIEFMRSDNGEVVHSIHVTGPGALEIPALRKEHGVPISVRVIYADGEIVELGYAP